MARVWQLRSIHRMAEVHAALRYAGGRRERGRAALPHDCGYTVTLRRGAGRDLAGFFADFALGCRPAGTLRLAPWFRWLSRYAECWRRGSRSRIACSAAAITCSIILVTV